MDEANRISHSAAHGPPRKIVSEYQLREQLRVRLFPAQTHPGTVLRLPSPYWVAAADEVSANWRIDIPGDYPEPVRLRMAELVVELMTEYDLEPPFRAP